MRLSGEVECLVDDVDFLAVGRGKVTLDQLLVGIVDEFVVGGFTLGVSAKMVLLVHMCWKIDSGWGG